MGLKFSNFGKAVVSSAPIGATGLNFTVEAGKGLLFPLLGPGDYFFGIFKDASGNREIVKIEARNADSLTIAADGRGMDGTAARNWVAGDYFVAGITNVALQESLSNSNLIALGGLASAADKVPYFTGPGTAALAGLSAFIRTLLVQADAAAARAALGAASADLIQAGTVMLFFQAAAPTGWTQVTTHNDKALRIVNGAGGASGGSVTFTNAFTAQAVTGSNSATTLTSGQIPWHTHSTIFYGTSGSGIAPSSGGSPSGGTSIATDGGTGGGSPHNHTFTGTAINLAVQYIDVIIARKD
ncbi:MAG TPA: hypothetical protein VHB01_09245 [Nitrosospira sp.]|nr:hypothetical protein [Nitrosospira sp.]